MEAAGMDKGKDEKLHTDANVQQGQRRRRGRRLILSLVLALMIVLLLHGAWRKTWPRIQGIEYEDANGDLVYGLRIYAPDVTTEGGVPRDWLIEVGKIPDDGLRDRQLSSYVGLADSWLYFRVTSGDDTHFLLASLWLANLVHREEAEAILRKGPSRQGSVKTPTIHRLPSLATLTMAYWAGTQVVLFEPMGPLDRVRPALAGGFTVVGVMLFFSRSSRDRSKQVPHERLTIAGFGHGPDAFRVGGMNWVKISRVLPVEELQDTVSWLPTSSGSDYVVAGRGESSSQDDWLLGAAKELRGE